MNARRATPLLLLLSLLVLAPMIPGGPVESRTFPEMPVVVAVSYNILITIVGLATIPLAIMTRRGGKRVLSMAAIDGVAFAVIYGLDLAHVFPGGPPMSARLIAFEAAGFVVALALIASALHDLSRAGLAPIATAHSRRLSLPIVLGAAIIVLAFGAVVVYFGTIHALH